MPCTSRYTAFAVYSGESALGFVSSYNSTAEADARPAMS